MYNNRTRSCFVIVEKKKMKKKEKEKEKCVSTIEQGKYKSFQIVSLTKEIGVTYK